MNRSVGAMGVPVHEVNFVRPSPVNGHVEGRLCLVGTK
jgi:hypothetical protein